MVAIDKKVKRLVKILNLYPDVETSGSCGGHKNPAPCQHPENEWTVTFEIWGKNKEADLPSKNGWMSLGKISHATAEYYGEADGDINLICCNLSDRETDPEGLCNFFEVQGVNADIEIFCNILERNIPRSPNPGGERDE